MKTEVTRAAARPAIPIPVVGRVLGPHKKPKSGSTPCFAAGTLVVTGIDSAGHLTTKNIEDVQVGDWVLARSQNDPAGPLEQRQVTAVEVHTVTSLRLLDIQEADGTTETIRTTDEHPFWVSDVGWVKAGDLQVGQELVTSDGRVATVTATRSEAHPDGIAVYNFTVDGDHTYFVTDVADDQAVWVHNQTLAGPVGTPPDPTQPPVGNPHAPAKPYTPEQQQRARDLAAEIADRLNKGQGTLDDVNALRQFLLIGGASLETATHRAQNHLDKFQAQYDQDSTWWGAAWTYKADVAAGLVNWGVGLVNTATGLLPSQLSDQLKIPKVEVAMSLGENAKAHYFCQAAGSVIPDIVMAADGILKTLGPKSGSALAREAKSAEGECASELTCFLSGTEVLLGDGEEIEIQDIHVGQRVATDAGVANSADGQTAAADPDATEVDPATWRLVKMHAVSVWADGTQDVYEIETLQPVSLLAGQNAQVGSLVPIPLDLKEMGVPDNMVYATIDSIGDCPAIETGSGRVVLTTVHHLNNYVFTLTLRDATGEEDTLGVTGFHKFYSETAGWESVDHLTLGETLRGADGKALTVVSVVRDPGTYEVYNMTVEADHVYYVGDLTALVHNACSGTSGENAAAATGRAAHEEFSALADAQGYTTKTALENGLIPDAFRISKDGLSAIVRELKPGNARAVAKGLRQLTAYAQQISIQFGIELKNISQILETY